MAQNGDGMTLAQIRSQIKEQQLGWVAEETFLSALPLDEKRRYLGLLVSDAELEQMRLEVQDKAQLEMARFAAEPFAAPAAKDWRSSGHVTPVKNQGNCGSCVSFGTCAAIEANARIKVANPGLNIDLSEAFMQFCGGGSCNGWGLTSGLDYAKSVGVTDEACFPYQPQDMPCSNRCADWQSRLTKITAYTAHASAQARKDAIAGIGPVVAGMRVYDDFFSYRSGVYQKAAGATSVGLHCICVVGYDDGQQCWIVKNSWGTGWGDAGYVRIRYGQADLLIDSSFAFYSVDVALEPPDGSGTAQHILVDDRFTGTPTLWAYAGNRWRYKTITQADLAGLVQVLFTANRVDVWWHNDEIRLIRPWRTP